MTFDWRMIQEIGSEDIGLLVGRLSGRDDDNSMCDPSCFVGSFISLVECWHS